FCLTHARSDTHENASSHPGQASVSERDDLVASATSSRGVIRCVASSLFGNTEPMLATHWPLFALRVTTPRVELRYPDDADCGELVEVAARGVHDPAFMPFQVPWTDIAPPRQQREALQHYWGTRATWTPERWAMPMAVV